MALVAETSIVCNQRSTVKHIKSVKAGHVGSSAAGAHQFNGMHTIGQIASRESHPLISSIRHWRKGLLGLVYIESIVGGCSGTFSHNDLDPATSKRESCTVTLVHWPLAFAPTILGSIFRYPLTCISNS